jgi:hypothetical protein
MPCKNHSLKNLKKKVLAINSTKKNDRSPFKDAATRRERWMCLSSTLAIPSRPSDTINKDHSKTAVSRGRHFKSIVDHVLHV